MGDSGAQNIKGDVWKIAGWSNCYLIKSGKNILIDCGSQHDTKLIRESLGGIRVDEILFTHLHYDHVYNYRLFPDARMLASEEELLCLKEDPEGTVLMPGLSKEIAKAGIIPFMEHPSLGILKTPGHTRGSVCYILEKERIIFTGDTYFGEGAYGRTDLPTSDPGSMTSSISSIKRYKDYLILPGHDYV